MSRRALLWSALAIAATSVFAWIGWSRTDHGAGDWVVFEVGARVLVHYHHQNIYGGNRWHLYVDNVDLQIGPPAFWLVAAFEWLPFRRLYDVFGVLLPVLSLLTIGGATLAGSWARSRAMNGALQANAAGLAAVATAGIWGLYAEASKHLDDVLALGFAVAAACLISKQRAWWLVAVLLGTSAATKPWAIILTPMLLGLPRRDIARAALVMLAVAAVWWAPFVISAPQTIQALGHFQVVPKPGSVLYLLGLHRGVQRWLRPTQFFVGVVIGCWTVRRSGWIAAPLAAIATRVATDPFAFGYYGLGPLIFAYLYDRAGNGYRGFPAFTAVTALAEFGPAFVTSNSAVIASSKLGWAVLVLATTLGRTRSKASGPPTPDGPPDCKVTAHPVATSSWVTGRRRASPG